VTSSLRRSGEPWYSSASFWLGPFAVRLALVVAVGMGVVWYILGGFPRDHDKYGSVSVPRQRLVRLPKGDVRLNFENARTRRAPSGRGPPL
jgi:hypothetical protein